MPEVWFDSLASAMAQRTDPQYTEFAHLDEPNVINMEYLWRVTAGQRVVRDPGEARAKLMAFGDWRSSDRGDAILAALHDHLDLTRARGFLREELRVVDQRDAGR